MIRGTEAVYHLLTAGQHAKRRIGHEELRHAEAREDLRQELARSRKEGHAVQREHGHGSVRIHVGNDLANRRVYRHIHVANQIAHLRRRLWIEGRVSRVMKVPELVPAQCVSLNT